MTPTETRVGKVRHFFGRINVAIVVCDEDGLAKGDTIHIKGHTTDFTMKVESMQVEHNEVPFVEKGKDIALKVTGRARVDDVVYKVKE